MLLIKVISLLPFGLLYTFGEIIAFIAYHIIRYRRNVVRQNLKQAFREKSDKDIKKIEVRFYRQLLQLFVEVIKSYRFKPSDWQKHMQFKNEEALFRYLDQGIPVILMTGHTANWEWPAFFISQCLPYPLEFLYKPVKNKAFDRIMLTLRTKHGGIAVPKDDAMRQFLRRRKQPRLIGMIADQLPSMGTDKYWVDFLNRDTAFYSGAERIARLAGYAVFYVEVVRKNPGRYEVTFHEIAGPPYTGDECPIIGTYVRRLEETIRNHPPDYLWSHRRWKYSKAEEEMHLRSLPKPEKRPSPSKKKAFSS